MRFMMMIPRVYQPDTPPGEKAGEGFAPPAEAVARMMKFNEELTKAGALIALDGVRHKGNEIGAKPNSFPFHMRWCRRGKSNLSPLCNSYGVTAISIRCR